MPDSDMLIALSQALQVPVSTLLGDSVAETDAEPLKAISEKLEVINLQLAKRKATRSRLIRWLLIALCAVIIIGFAVLWAVKSPYLAWDYSNPETAVLATAAHSLEWLFVRVAPVLLIGALIGIFFTRKKD